jgi:glucose uptake protein GlcU
MVLGVIFAIIVSVLFATYAIPRKFSRQNAMLYTMWIGIGYLLCSLVFCLIAFGFGLVKHENMLSLWHLWSLLRGFIWVLGIAAFNLAIDKIGLTRFNQWKNFQGPVGSVLMLTILSDVIGFEKIMFLVLGMIVMFISALFFTIKPETDDRKNTVKGVALALFSAVCFGVTAFINKLMTDQGFVYSQLIYHSLAVVLSAGVLFLITKRKPRELFAVDKKTYLPILAGVMYLGATILTILSYQLIPGSVSWSLTQLNAVWMILIGIIFFKEVNFKRHWLRISLGFLFAIGAMVLLFFAL